MQSPLDDVETLHGFRDMKSVLHQTMSKTIIPLFTLRTEPFRKLSPHVWKLLERKLNTQIDTAKKKFCLSRPDGNHDTQLSQVSSLEVLDCLNQHNTPRTRIFNVKNPCIEKK